MSTHPSEGHDGHTINLGAPDDIDRPSREELAEVIEVPFAEEASVPGYDITPPPVLPVRYAFVVYETLDGKIVATTEISGSISAQDPQDPKEPGITKVLVPEREATLYEVRRASHEVIADITEMSQTQAVIQAQVHYAQAMAQQAHTDALMAKLNGGQRPPGR